jgi:hypothetical protein
MLYGLEAQSLAWPAGISVHAASEILARLRARFRVFEEFCSAVNDHAGLDLTISTNFGWTMHCPLGTKGRVLRNWLVRSASSEIMHAVCILAARRGVSIVAPIHDAFMAEGPAADIEDVSHELDRVIRDAAAFVLHGCELPTDPGDGPVSGPASAIGTRTVRTCGT